MLLKLTSSLLLGLFLLGSGMINTTMANPIEAQAIAQSPRRANRGPERQKVLEQLNLTSEQEQKIAAIREKNKGESRRLRQEIRTNQQDLQDLMGTNATDAELRSKHQQISNLWREMSNLNFESMLEIRQVLTPSQRAQMAEIMKNRRGSRGGQNPETSSPDAL